MLTPLSGGFIIAGLLLAFVGATVTVYAVTLTGLLVGAGAGYLVAPNLVGVVAVDGVMVTAGVVTAGGLVGGFIAYAGLSFAVLGIAGIVGGFGGRFVVGPVYAADATGLEGTGLLVGATLGGIAVGMLLGFVLTKTTLMVSTAFLGAAFASRSLTPTTFETVAAEATVAPLVFDPTAPLFVAVFALGVLSQIGLVRLGYVTKLTQLLPGAGQGTTEKETGPNGS